MSLATELAALRQSKPRTFEQWLETASYEDRDMVMDAIGDHTIPANRLAVTLANNNVPITRETVLKYRDTRN